MLSSSLAVIRLPAPARRTGRTRKAASLLIEDPLRHVGYRPEHALVVVVDHDAELGVQSDDQFHRVDAVKTEAPPEQRLVIGDPVRVDRQVQPLDDHFLYVPAQITMLVGP